GPKTIRAAAVPVTASAAPGRSRARASLRARAMDSARVVPLAMRLTPGRGLGLIEIVDHPLIAELHGPADRLLLPAFARSSGPADRLLVAAFARTSGPAVARFRHASLRLVVFRPSLTRLMRRPGIRSTVRGLLCPPAIPLTLIRVPLIRLPRHGFALRVLVLA